MKLDARFKTNIPDVDGFIHGTSRRGQPVKIRATVAVQGAFVRYEHGIFGGAVLTVQCPTELFDRAKPGDTLEVVLCVNIDKLD